MKRLCRLDLTIVFGEADPPITAGVTAAGYNARIWNVGLISSTHPLSDPKTGLLGR
jgi:hypothetical protein